MNTRRHVARQWLVLSFLGAILALTAQCDTARSRQELREAKSEDILELVQTHRGSNGVLLNFWATWCEPCIEEFPMIVELGKEYASQGLIVYFVSVDWLDNREKVLDFLRQYNATGLSFIKNQDDNTFIDNISEAWTGAIPFTIVYGKSTGNVVDFWEGKEPQERFVSTVEKALRIRKGGSKS